MNAMRRVGLLLLGLMVAATAGLMSPSAKAGPPPIDPRRMSGIPRADDKIPGATVTVRVLRGSFSKPALDHPVTLDVTSADGGKKETLSVNTKNQGRATFSDLGPYVGGRAVAKVELDGENLQSAAIDIRGDIGTAVMLVSSAGPAGDPGTAPRRPSQPMPGQVFEFDKVAVGELMVGAFDLEARKPFVGLEIKLEVLAPDGTKTTQTKTSDTDGKVIFDGMDALPEGTKLTAEAKLGAEGPLQRSQTFEPLPGKGMGVVLAKGRMPTAPTAQPQRRRRLPGPRMVPSMQQGTVRVRVVDGNERGVPNQPVTVVMRDASQTETTFDGTTDATGVAMIADVTVRSDSFYNVRVPYDQGPYRSGFFQMDKSGGIAVDVRVFETTADPGALQARLQYEIHGAENDEAIVYRIYEVIVGGDKAFWPPGGMELHASEDAKGLTVLDPSKRWLDHEGAAPFATLSRPIPPGEPAHLSIAWMQEHDGELEMSWQPPFKVINAAVIIDDEQELSANGKKLAEKQPPNGEAQLWELPATGTALVEFSVDELPIRNPVFRYIAIVFGIGLALVAGAAIVLTPRRTAKERLLARRNELLALLDGAPSGSRRSRVVAALDRVYRQLDALDGTRASAPKQSTKSKTAKKASEKASKKASKKDA